jgi:hypothetical protein
MTKPAESGFPATKHAGFQAAHGFGKTAHSARDAVVFEAGLLEEAMEEVLPRMSALKANEIRTFIRRDPSFAETLKRVTIDVGMVLMFAKTVEADELFNDCVGLIRPVDMTAGNGLAGAYAKALVRCDLDSMELATAPGSDLVPGAYLYECMPSPVISRRLDEVLQLIETSIR